MSTVGGWEIVHGEPVSRWYAGLDLGQAQDWTALCLLEARPVLLPAPDAETARAIAAGQQPPLIETHYHARHLERIRGESYPRIVEHVQAVLARPPLKAAERVLDTTLRLLETHDLAGRVAALEAQAGAATGPRRLA